MSAVPTRRIFLRWGPLAVVAVPRVALANTGPMPPELGLLVLSLFVVIPGVAIFAVARILISWRKGLLGGLWVVSVLVAAGFGGLWLWAHLTVSEPRSLSSWPSIYLSLVPVLGIWVASIWNKKRDTQQRVRADREVSWAARNTILPYRHMATWPYLE